MGIYEIPVVLNTEAFPLGSHDIAVLDIQLGFCPELEVVEGE